MTRSKRSLGRSGSGSAPRAPARRGRRCLRRRCRRGGGGSSAAASGWRRAATSAATGGGLLGGRRRRAGWKRSWRSSSAGRRTLMTGSRAVLAERAGPGPAAWSERTSATTSARDGCSPASPRRPAASTSTAHAEPPSRWPSLRADSGWACPAAPRWPSTAARRWRSSAPSPRGLRAMIRFHHGGSSAAAGARRRGAAASAGVARVRCSICKRALCAAKRAGEADGAARRSERGRSSASAGEPDAMARQTGRARCASASRGRLDRSFCGELGGRVHGCFHRCRVSPQLSVAGAPRWRVQNGTDAAHSTSTARSRAASRATSR